MFVEFGTQAPVMTHQPVESNDVALEIAWQDEKDTPECGELVGLLLGIL